MPFSNNFYPSWKTDFWAFFIYLIPFFSDFITMWKPVFESFSSTLYLFYVWIALKTVFQISCFMSFFRFVRWKPVFERLLGRLGVWEFVWEFWRLGGFRVLFIDLMPFFSNSLTIFWIPVFEPFCQFNTFFQLFQNHVKVGLRASFINFIRF